MARGGVFICWNIIILNVIRYLSWNYLLCFMLSTCNKHVFNFVHPWLVWMDLSHNAWIQRTTNRWTWIVQHGPSFRFHDSLVLCFTAFKLRFPLHYLKEMVGFCCIYATYKTRVCSTSLPGFIFHFSNVKLFIMRTSCPECSDITNINLM